jgi:hypothetical protein
MTRRRVLLLGCVTAVVVIVVAAWALWPAPTAITTDNAAWITQGMPLADVEAILGGPARDETTGPVERIEPPEFASPDARGNRWRIAIVDMRPDVQRWESDRARVWVQFDQNGLATDCQVFPLQRRAEGALAALRRWLHL